MKKNLLLKILTLVLGLTLTLVLGCTKEQDEKNILMMATTTSTDNTGLLDYLKPEFKKDTGLELRWVAVGTGKALQMGQNCDVDVLLVHAPDSEKKFLNTGFGRNRTEIMYNDFVIIGPAVDPAKIKGKTVKDAMKTIKAKKAVFASRGDKSGTHSLELKLWKESGIAIPEKESWYMSTGQGMLDTIKVATEKNGYTITDRGTFIKYEASLKGKEGLVILVENDKILFNQYSAIEINPEKCTKAKNTLAKQFIDWMVSDRVQKLIADFKLEGKQLFTPNAKK